MPFWLTRIAILINQNGGSLSSVGLQHLNHGPYERVLCPSRHSNLRFHASSELLVWSPPFNVSSWTFHVVGGKRGRRRRGRTSSVHDHFGTWGGPLRYDHFGTYSLSVQLRYTERTIYVPFRYIHFGTFSNDGLNNDLHGRYMLPPRTFPGN